MPPGVAAALPSDCEARQVYALMTALYGASAAFIPPFQAMSPLQHGSGQQLSDLNTYDRK